jgi:hypothetical protein
VCATRRAASGAREALAEPALKAERRQAFRIDPRDQIRFLRRADHGVARADARIAGAPNRSACPVNRSWLSLLPRRLIPPNAVRRAALLGDVLAAPFAFLEAFAARNAGARLEDRIGDAVMDLVLNRALGRPTICHGIFAN